MMLQIIDEFWKTNDMYNLKQQLSYEIEFVESDWFNDITDLNFFFPNLGFDFESFRNSKVFCTYESVCLKNYDNSVKHKKLNDANKIYLNN